MKLPTKPGECITGTCRFCGHRMVILARAKGVFSVFHEAPECAEMTSEMGHWESTPPVNISGADMMATINKEKN